MTHVPWPKIQQFPTVRKYAKDNGIGVLKYRGKIKLHGTNAAVRIDPDGSITCQSRERVITPTSDNYGFAAWVDSERDYFVSLADPRGNCSVVVFGEWVGPGIQQKVACSQIPKRSFFVFSIVLMLGDSVRMFADATAIEASLKPHAHATLPAQMHVIPYEPAVYEINMQAYGDELMAGVVSTINQRVLEIEACDPLIAERFGINGCGEGLVLYPQTLNPWNDYKAFCEYGFKAKGNEHNTVQAKAPVVVDPGKAANVGAFAEMVTTEARCAQMAALTNGECGTFNPRNIPEFLERICGDIAAECTAELDASGLEFADVKRACSVRARTWYLAQVHAQQLSA